MEGFMQENKITTEVFEKEISMCQELYKEKKGCNWGKCEDCAVIPLLYKLGKGELYETEAEVKELKVRVFADIAEEDDWEEIKSRMTRSS